MTDVPVRQLDEYWLESARSLVLSGELDAAGRLLTTALVEHHDSIEIRYALAGIHLEAHQYAQAESLLCELLAEHSDHAASSFQLARMYKNQGRLQAAGRILRTLFGRNRHDPDLLIQAVELLDESGRQTDAAAICEAELAAGSTDPRLHAYAGMLQIQLGQFEQARKNYMIAIAQNARALEWNIPIGLSSLQRYDDINHPDFDLFREGLQQPWLNDQTRTSLLFALGKAHDDVGDFATAHHYLRKANALAHEARRWSRKHWRRAVEARIAGNPLPYRCDPVTDWTPVFIVGVPRSGTTLVAELLSRHPDVCNRGELQWIPLLAKQLSLIDRGDPALLRQAASIYEAQLRQDDSAAHWFIDKQPLNLMRIDLILALWPNARIVFCQRNARDIALSLWFQYFTEEEQNFAYDFADITVVIQSCRLLMAHWQNRFGSAIYTVRYEQLVADPTGGMAALGEWLNLPACSTLDKGDSISAISTGSVWQARQPVYTRSTERWRDYAPYLPELLKLPQN